MSEDEPADKLTESDLQKLLSIVHSMELRYGMQSYEKVVAGIIVNTALDHILINGNKRLSLIFGYFCSYWFGHHMVLMDGNFARMIKEVVISVCNEDDSKEKNRVRINAIKALAKEIKDFSIPIEEKQPIDCSFVSRCFAFLKSKI